MVEGNFHEHHLEIETAIAIGDVVIVKDDKLKRCFWKLALVKQLFPVK